MGGFTLNYLLSGATQAGGSSLIMIVAFALLIGFTYFTMLRPQKKQQQERLAMMKALNKGDRVIMISGLHGVIDTINDQDNTVVIDADGIFLTFNTSAIRSVEAHAADKTETPVKEAEATTVAEDKKAEPEVTTEPKEDAE